jgi:hypothetical protein
MSQNIDYLYEDPAMAPIKPTLPEEQYELLGGSSKGRIALAMLIITLGVGWLLTTQGVGPGINWVWTLGLGIVGVMVFVVSGVVDKLSVVIGPFFLIASILSILRQTSRIQLDVEMPVLVIAVGGLLLLAQWPVIVAPRWLVPLPRQG